MYQRPTFDFGNLLTLFCILFALGIASVLGGCTTAKPATYTPPVGTHSSHQQHDARTRQQEPNRSRIR